MFDKNMSDNDSQRARCEPVHTAFHFDDTELSTAANLAHQWIDNFLLSVIAQLGGRIKSDTIRTCLLTSSTMSRESWWGGMSVSFFSPSREDVKRAAYQTESL